MAKRKTTTALAVRAPAPTVIAIPTATRRARAGALVRRGATRVVRGARRGAAIAGRGAWQKKEAVAMVGGAGLVGYLEGAGHLDFLPDLVPGADTVGRVPTLALATYGIGWATKSPKIKTLGLGLAAAAAFGFGLDKGRAAKK